MFNTNGTASKTLATMSVVSQVIDPDTVFFEIVELVPFLNSVQRELSGSNSKDRHPLVT
jgi:hypothetical protein